MFIDLEIERVTSGIGYTRNDARYVPPGSGRLLTLDVHPREREHIALATGEHFRHPRYHVKKDMERISAVLHIIELGEEERCWEMRYHGPISSDDNSHESQIAILVQLDTVSFEDIYSKLFAGHVPEYVTIFFADNAELKYGWEPDGSGMAWENKAEHPLLKLEWIRFNFELLKPMGGESLLKDYIAPISEIDLRDREQVAKAMLIRMDAWQTHLRNLVYIGAGIFFALMIMIWRG
jgi:hypothetical protein